MSPTRHPTSERTTGPSLDDLLSAAERADGQLHEIWTAAPRRQKAWLKALAAYPEIIRAATGRGYTNDGKTAYHVGQALYVIDSVMSGADRRILAEKLLPYLPKPNIPKALKGSKVVPLPDLTGWYGAHAFWVKVKPVEGSKCWEWSGGSSDQGYGRVKVYGRLYSTHRVAYTLKYGPIPVGDGYHGTLVMHACDNPRCCNPAHLTLGTARDNARDMARKGRGATQRKARAPAHEVSA